jgi:hypothetical protein
VSTLPWDHAWRLIANLTANYGLVSRPNDFPWRPAKIILPHFTATDSHQSPADIQAALLLEASDSHLFVPIIPEDFHVPEGCAFQFSQEDSVQMRASLVVLSPGYLTRKQLP